MKPSLNYSAEFMKIPECLGKNGEEKNIQQKDRTQTGSPAILFGQETDYTSLPGSSPYYQHLFLHILYRMHYQGTYGL